MSEFIVLGLVPGTNTQLTFGFWLSFIGALLALVISVKLWRSRRLRVGLVAVRLALEVRFRRDTLGVQL